THHPPPTTPTLHPYTTLFRSGQTRHVEVEHQLPRIRIPGEGAVAGYHAVSLSRDAQLRERSSPRQLLLQPAQRAADLRRGEDPRSEEHTSELQSRFDLVCRLV